MGVTNCLVFLTFPYPVPAWKIVQFLLAATLNHMQVKLKNQKNKRVIIKSKRNHTQKNDHERKDQNFENQGNYKMH